MTDISSSDLEPRPSLSAALDSQGKLRQLELWLSFAKFAFGTFVIGIFTLLLNHQVQQREISIKEKDQQQQYLKNFIAQAMEQDLEKRESFAQYFAILLGDRWKDYHLKVKADLESRNAILVEKNAQLSQAVALAASAPASQSRAPASSTNSVKPLPAHPQPSPRVETLRQEITSLQLEVRRRSSTDYEALFPSVRAQELKLSQLGEEAFSSGNYLWTIRFLEQARTVQGSGVWQSSYPYLIGSYLMLRQSQKADEAVSQMLAAMDQQYGYLTSSITQGFVLSALGRVRTVVPNEYVVFLDATIDKVLERKKKTVG